MVTGKTQSGLDYARAVSGLSQKLQERNIALLGCTIKKKRWYEKRLQVNQAMAILERLATLLESGVHLHHALAIIASTIGSLRLCTIVEGLADSVERGELLGKAMGRYPQLFSPFVQAFCTLGHEGSLARIMRILCSYLAIQYECRKQLRAVSLMPLITSLVFIGVLGGLLYGVVPRFEELFTSLKLPIEGMTGTLFSLSAFITGGECGAVIIILFLIGVLLKKTFVADKLYYYKEQLLILIPLFHSYVRLVTGTLFFSALGALLSAGVPLIDALNYAAHTVPHSIVRKRFMRISTLINEGNTLSNALKQTHCVSEEYSSLVVIAEHTGNLAQNLISCRHIVS